MVVIGLFQSTIILQATRLREREVIIGGQGAVDSRTRGFHKKLKGLQLYGEIEKV